MCIHWHRRDLRIADNRGLAGGEEVLPMFVFDPAVLDHASMIRVACLLDAIADLRERYRERGGDLLVERGDPTEVILWIADSWDTERVSWNADYSGFTRARDRAAIATLEDQGVEWDAREDALLKPDEPGAIPALDELGFDEPEADPPEMGREPARNRFETFCTKTSTATPKSGATPPSG